MSDLLDRPCIALDPDCPDCARMARRRPCAAIGGCGDSCGMVCRMLATPEGHAAIHAAQRCPRCGVWKYAEDGTAVEVQRRCKYGNCTQWHCPECDVEWGSDGPIGCPCNTSWLTRLLLRLGGVFVRRAQ